MSPALRRRLGWGGAALVAPVAGWWLNTLINPQIYKGEDVPAGVFLGVVGLTSGTDRRPYCSGSLVARDMVLTAAHCVCGRPSEKISVLVGDGTVRDGSARATYHAVSGWRAHPLCSKKPSRETLGSTAVDVAVVRLREPVTGVRPFSFAPDAVVGAASSYRVVGFGAIDERGRIFARRKREAVVPSLSNDCAQPGEPTLYGCQRGEEIVAGRRRSSDTCRGDSGGPLLVGPAGDAGSRSDDRLLLAGTTSRSVKSSVTACGYGGIYERLRPPVRAWILSAMKSLAGGTG